VNRENKREMRFFLPLFEKEYLEENIVFTRIYGIININQREKRRVERCVKGARRKGQIKSNILHQ